MTIEQLSVQLGNLVADGATADDDGHVWTCHAIDGWYDSTAVRVAQSETAPAGEVITLARENARAISLTLTASNPGLPAPEPLGKDGIGAARALLKLNAHIVYVPTLLIVEDTEFSAGSLSAYVRRVGAVKDTVLGENIAVMFQLPLLAPDPLRYEGTSGSGTGHD